MFWSVLIYEEDIKSLSLLFLSSSMAEISAYIAYISVLYQKKKNTQD